MFLSSYKKNYGLLRRVHTRGHTLVEVSLSIGLMSGGLLIFAPLMTVGMQQNQQAQDKRLAAQMAETFFQEAEQGTLQAGTYGLDQQGSVCSLPQAIYLVTVTKETISSGVTRLYLKIVSKSAPRSAISYAALTDMP